jgi:hypothetical protein
VAAIEPWTLVARGVPGGTGVPTITILSGFFAIVAVLEKVPFNAIAVPGARAFKQVIIITP